MATVTGAWVPNSSTNKRMQLILMYDIELTSTKATVTGSVIVNAAYGFNDSSNTFAWSGSLLGSGSTSKNINVPTNGSQTIHTFSKTVNRTSSAQGMSVAFSLTGIDYVGATASVAATVSIPAQSSKPATPGNVELRINTSSGLGTLNWTGGAVNIIEVMRRTEKGSGTAPWTNTWERVGDSTFTTGTGVSLALGYQWKARVQRTSGSLSSDWGGSNADNAFRAPDAPSFASVASNSDTKQTISLGSYVVPANAPILTVDVQRWLESDQNWKNAAAGLKGTTRTWIETTNLANNRGRWRVRFWNAAGGSEWIYTTYVSGTPAKPTEVAGSRSGATDIIITCKNNARAAAYFDIYGQSSADGTNWSADTTVATGLTPPANGATFTRTVTGLDNTKRWRFAVVARVVTPTTRVARSDYSNAVQLLSAPNKPTVVGPTGTQAAGSNVTLTWKHNPVDGSAQTAAIVTYTVDNGPVQTVNVNNADQFVTINDVAPGTFDWQVKTKGAHASYSQPSNHGIFIVANPPAVTIISPLANAVISANRFSLELGYTDPQNAAMTAWVGRLYDDAGVLLETRQGNSAITALTFNRRLADQSTYTAEVAAQAGTGLWSAAQSVSISTLFNLPVAPVLDATWNRDTGIATLAIANVAGTLYSWRGTPYGSASEQRDAATGDLLYVNDFKDPFGEATDWWTTSANNHLSTYRDQELTGLRVTIGDPGAVIATSGPCGGIGSGDYWSYRLTIVALNSAAAGTQINTEVKAGLKVIATSNPVMLGATGDAQTIVVAGTTAMTASQAVVLAITAGSPAARIGAEFLITGVTLESSGASGTAVLAPEAFNGATKSSDSTVANRIERSDDGGGTWVVLADSAGIDISMLDLEARLNTEVHWRATAISALGAEASSAIATLFTEASAAFVTTRGTVLALPYTLSLPGDSEVDVQLVRMLGRRKRIAIYPLDRDPDHSVSLSGITINYREEDAWRAMLLEPVFYRDPTGRAFRAVVTSPLGWDPRSYGWADVTATFTEIEDV